MSLIAPAAHIDPDAHFHAVAHPVLGGRELLCRPHARHANAAAAFGFSGPHVIADNLPDRAAVTPAKPPFPVLLKDGPTSKSRIVFHADTIAWKIVLVIPKEE